MAAQQPDTDIRIYPCDREANGLLLPPINKRDATQQITCCKQTIKTSFLRRRDHKRRSRNQTPPLCIQKVTLGDEYGNGPRSTGTIAFQRGRSGSAVRFD